MKSTLPKGAIPQILCLGPVTDALVKGISFARGIAAPLIKELPDHLQNLRSLDDLANILALQPAGTLVYLNCATACCALMMRAMVANLDFGFFEKGTDGKLRLYHIHFLNIELVWEEGWEELPKSISASR